MKNVKHKKAYTIGEIVITVAIIGALSAMAIPNYMRIRMNVNMELVKQHLKVIGEEMTGIMGKTGKFVAQETWGSGTTEEEMVITANLNGMKNKGYDTDQYTTDQNRASYQFRTCPQKGNWGISGDRCFVLDSLGVKEVEPWDGTGMDMYAWSFEPVTIFSYFLLDTSISQKSKIDLLVGTLENLAYLAINKKILMTPAGSPNSQDNRTISTLLPFYEVDKSVPAYQELFPKVYEELGKKGIQASYAMRDNSDLLSIKGGSNILMDRAVMDTPQYILKIAEVGFQFDDQTAFMTDYSKQQESHTTPQTIENLYLDKKCYTDSSGTLHC